MVAPVIAALFVARGGVYTDLPGVDAWTEDRDARRYSGPWPVVAHPPCARWGAYWYGSPSGSKRYKLGDDGDCFASALAAVDRFGGVLEHPAGSLAWPAFGIPAPLASGGWSQVFTLTGPRVWTCCVEQGHYGHRARKRTWLYCCGPAGFSPPSLLWGSSAPALGPSARARTRGAVERMSHRERLGTPPAFRDLLLSIARSCARVHP